MMAITAARIPGAVSRARRLSKSEAYPKNRNVHSERGNVDGASWHTFLAYIVYSAYIDPLFPVIKEQQGAQVLPLLQHWFRHGEMRALKQYCVC
jgi:hypothetical protein